MSYDLYFYKKRTSQLTQEHVAGYLDDNLSHNNSEHPKQWCYENPDTGVYFLVDWNQVDNDPEYLKEYDKFPNFKHLNFSLSINFFRPRFFGIEIFPIIEKFITDLDLYVLNPQDEKDPDSPKKFSPGYLQDQWIRHNDIVTFEQFTELFLRYLPLEKSTYLWRFQTKKEELQNSLQDDIFVPGYLVLKSKEDEKLYTTCVWPQHIPIILPPVDYVIIVKKYRKFFKKIEETGLVPYDVIMKHFGDKFEEFEYVVPSLKVIRQANADKIRKQFDALKLGKPPVEFGSHVAFDGFVNLHP